MGGSIGGLFLPVKGYFASKSRGWRCGWERMVGLTPRQPVDPLDYTKDLSCPLLGLFGREDKRPSPEHVAKTEAELKKWGKTYEFHTYDNAGHSFFTVDRAAYRVEAAMEGWKESFNGSEDISADPSGGRHSRTRSCHVSGARVTGFCRPPSLAAHTGYDLAVCWTSINSR